MTDFFANLLEAMRVVVNTLEGLTMTVNNSAISIMDCIEYSMIIYTALWFIKSMSKDGLFTISSEKRMNMHERRFRKE